MRHTCLAECMPDRQGTLLLRGISTSQMMELGHRAEVLTDDTLRKEAAGSGSCSLGLWAQLLSFFSNQAVKEILDTWENMKFTVVKYYKGTQERGYILGSVDEIIQCLDDNTVNLQSISGSRFVGPFLQTVHKWEKTLSLIGEVIEVRAKQTKCAAKSCGNFIWGHLCLEMNDYFMALDLFMGRGWGGEYINGDSEEF